MSSERKPTYKNIHQMDWKKGSVTYKKMLAEDEDTGMFVGYYYYPEGVITPPHHHDCSHGMYVIEGTLHTADGEFGPGTMVWFPKGCINEHGSAGPQGLSVLFITNGPFNIVYEDK